MSSEAWHRSAEDIRSLSVAMCLDGVTAVNEITGEIEPVKAYTYHESSTPGELMTYLRVFRGAMIVKPLDNSTAPAMRTALGESAKACVTTGQTYGPSTRPVCSKSERRFVESAQDPEGIMTVFTRENAPVAITKRKRHGDMTSLALEDLELNFYGGRSISVPIGTLFEVDYAWHDFSRRRVAPIEDEAYSACLLRPSNFLLPYGSLSYASRRRRLVGLEGLKYLRTRARLTQLALS